MYKGGYPREKNNGHLYSDNHVVIVGCIFWDLCQVPCSSKDQERKRGPANLVKCSGGDSWEFGIAPAQDGYQSGERKLTPDPDSGAKDVKEQSEAI